jgi:aspartyl-tRNA(Asn)/glutamyl-tRNA(Gln) amidotransferase subunit A
MSTIREIVAAHQGGTPIAATIEATLAKLEGDTINAVIRVYRDSALTLAAQVQQRLASGENLPLAGVPVLLKDNLLYTDHPAEACSQILQGFVSTYTGTAVQNLLDAGAIPVGAANMDEFAMGSSNETSIHGPVLNPHDHERIPGGSSGGSAAAVAAGLVPVALGSDTGGSIRQPAALCGCVGSKPSYGAVSRYGLIAFGSSLDQIGPLTQNAADARLVQSVLSGHDPRDSTSLPRDWAFSADSKDYWSGKKIGVIQTHRDGAHPSVQAALDAAQTAITAAGASIVPIELPHEHAAVATYYIIGTGEASSNLSRFDGVHYGYRAKNPSDLDELYCKSRGEGFGPEVQRRIMLGTFVLSAGYADAYYKKAQKVRRLIANDFAQAFESCDLLLGPTSMTTAFKAGEKTDPLQMYLSDVCTISANLAGIPALSLPWGADEAGLPIGLQLLAPFAADDLLLAGAEALEALAP